MSTSLPSTTPGVGEGEHEAGGVELTLFSPLRCFLKNINFVSFLSHFTHTIVLHPPPEVDGRAAFQPPRPNTQHREIDAWSNGSGGGRAGGEGVTGAQANLYSASLFLTV